MPQLQNWILKLALKYMQKCNLISVEGVSLVDSLAMQLQPAYITTGSNFLNCDKMDKIEEDFNRLK